MAASASEREEMEHELAELEINIKRLRIEYEQFFRGAMKREPSALRGKVQKVITRFVSEPPRNPAIKFRFNSLNARYQSFRQLWGRTIREIEAGTYAPHKFRIKVHDSEQAEQVKELTGLERQSAELERKREETAAAAAPGGSAFDRLHSALVSARAKTGESTQELTRERLAQLVKRQTEMIRDQRGADAKVKFRVVIEGNRAKLKATVV